MIEFKKLIREKVYKLKTERKINKGTVLRTVFLLILVAATAVNSIGKDSSSHIDEDIIFYEAIEVENSPNEEEKDKININNASLDELDTLPGIGPSKAQNIITYREEYGDFVVIDEIKEVKGIGDAIFNQIKEYISVE